MIRLRNMSAFEKLTFVSFLILVALMLLFVRGQVFEDSFEGKIGPFGYRFTNGSGMVRGSVAAPVSPRSAGAPPRPEPLVTYYSERVTSHSMFWLSDGNPFGVRINRRGHDMMFSGHYNCTIELDIGLLLLLAGAMPGYWWFAVRRKPKGDAL